MVETPSKFIVVCPNCLISLRVKYAWSGRHVRCKHCNHKFQALAPDFPLTPSLDESAAAVLTVNSISSEVDRMSVVCPSCSASLRVRSIHAGRYVRCGQCEEKFVVPSVVQAPGQANLTSIDANLLNQLNGKLEHPHADPQPREAARAVPESELETVRGVLGRFIAEFGTLQQDRVRIRMERNTIRDRFKRLRGKYELLKSERDNDRSEHQRLGAEYATISEALGALTPDDIGILKAEQESLRRERDRIVAELGTLREDRNAIQSERDSIQALLEQLGGELDRLRSEQDRERQQHHRRDAELATIREALGASTPVDIGILKGDHESLRRERDRIVAELGTLREDRNAMQSERDSIQAQLEQLGGELDRLRSEQDQERQEHHRRGAELATIREALGASTPEDIGILKAEQESLHRERDRIVAELGTLREDRNAMQSERDSTQALLEQLGGELDRLRSEQDQEGQEHHRRGAELATIREALEPFTPGEISSLKAERESFKTETDRLREQVQTLRGELSARGNPAELLAQRDAEIQSARVLGDQLKEQIRHLEAALEGAQADRDQWNQEVRDQHDQLEAARAQCDRLSERIHVRDEALESSHAKLEEIAHQLRGRDDELSGKQAEQERLAEQLQAALNDAKLLLTTLAQREQEVRLESHQRHAQVDDLHRTLDEAVKNHLHERDRLAEQLRLTREQLESEVSQRTALQARIGELQDALQKLKIDRGTVLGSERPRLTAEFHSTTGAKRSVPTEALAEVQLSAQENARPVDRLNASIVALAQSLITPDADDSPAQSRVAPDAGLEVARQEIEVLRKKIAELEKSKQSLSSMLDNMGIKVR